MATLLRRLQFSKLISYLRCPPEQKYFHSLCRSTAQVNEWMTVGWSIMTSQLKTIAVRARSLEWTIFRDLWDNSRCRKCVNVCYTSTLQCCWTQAFQWDYSSYSHFLLLQRHRDPRFFVFFSLVSVLPSVRCCVQSQTWAVCESVLWESVCGHTGLCWLTLYPALKHTRSQKPESNEKLRTERSKHCTVFRGGRWNVQMQCIWEINEPSFQLKGQQASG